MLISRALPLLPGDVVALAGAGGKTTLMFRLAAELTASGHHVVTSMTTRIFRSQMDLAPASLVAEDEASLLARLPHALARYGHVLVAGSATVEADKVAGIPVALVARLAALPDVDVVILEADGSRRLPFKAPAPHEPVIPEDATLVISVVGVDAIGQPLGPAIAHRPEQIAALTGASLGDAITPGLVAQVLTHPEGGAQHVPPGARLVPFINKVEDDGALDLAREVARLALEVPRVDRVVIGAAQADDPVHEVWTRAGAVVLAAGAASRFGALKQVLPWHGRPLVAHVVDQALACPDLGHVVVTAGAGADRVEIAVGDRPVHVARVPAWQAGQSRSVQAGLNALREQTPGSLGAALFLLADQPGISPELLAALVARHRETLAPVVAPRYRGRRGNPVLFDAVTFPAFAALEGDVGARPILNAHADEIAWVDWPTPEITQDIDTAADYPAEAADA